MESYDAPTDIDYDSMTPEVAQGEINKLEADMSGDLQHPLFQSGHSQHKEFVTHRDKLYGITVNAEQAEAEAAEARQIEALEALPAAEQAKLVTEANAEMELLKKHGFHDEIPPDIAPYQVLGLKMQRLNLERDFEQLTPLVKEELLSLREDPAMIGAFEQFSAMDIQVELKEKIAFTIIEYMYDQSKDKHDAQAKLMADAIAHSNNE